ncbi:hypothetical protein HDV01_001644 [Terramyces sp. JEL0728]|nr:hypothetical protein HDV01_001644 [Terramyces sp. JEL0728]
MHLISYLLYTTLLAAATESTDIAIPAQDKHKKRKHKHKKKRKKGILGTIILVPQVDSQESIPRHQERPLNFPLPPPRDPVAQQVPSDTPQTQTVVEATHTVAVATVAVTNVGVAADSTSLPITFFTIPTFSAQSSANKPEISLLFILVILL